MDVLVVALTTVTVYGFGPLYEHCVTVASPGETCSVLRSKRARRTSPWKDRGD